MPEFSTDSIPQNEFLEVLVEQSPLPLAVTFGPEHYVRFLNKAFRDTISRFIPEQLDQYQISEIVEDHLKDTTRAVLDEAYRLGISTNIENVIMPLPDGSFVYWSTHIKPFFHPQQPATVIGLLIYVQDITATVLSEQRYKSLMLAESERAQELQVILDNISDGVIVRDGKGALLSINPKACEIVGTTVEAVRENPGIIVDSVESIHNLDGSPTSWEKFPAILARKYKKFYQDDVIYKRKDGSSVFTNVSSTPVLDEQGEIKMVVSVFQDISPRIEAENKQKELLVSLEREQNKLNSIINDLGVGLLVVEKEGRVILANKQFTTMTALPSSYFFGRDIEELVEYFTELLADPFQGKSIIQHVMSHPTEHHVFEFSLHQLLNIDVRVVVFPILDNQEELIAWGCLLEDITRSKQLLQLRSQFVATASHELRTPMTGVVGFAELLLNREVSPELRERWTRHIYNESLRVSHLIENMLNISRLEAGVLQLERTPFVLWDSFQQAYQRAKVKLPSCGIIFKLEGLEEWETKILADEKRLLQSVRRVVDNAFKFSLEEKPVIITISLFQGTLIPGPNQSSPPITMPSNRRWLLISVQDFGIGIPAEDMPHIFEPFFRVKTTIVTTTGTGLGLPIAKKLVELHGGYMWAESIVGEGSTFYLAYPLS